MAPEILLLISAGAVVAAVAILIVNDAHRRRRIRRGGGVRTEAGSVQTTRWPDRAECVDFGVALTAALAMAALLWTGLPTLKSYLSFILFHVALVTGLAFGLDHRLNRNRRTRPQAQRDPPPSA